MPRLFVLIRSVYNAMPAIGPFHYDICRDGECYIPASHRVLLKNLASYYDDLKLRRHILQTTPDRHTVSLRLLDWFVTNYSKKKQTCWLWKDSTGNHRVVQAHDTYVTENKNWKRVLFDCFQRRKRIKYRHPDSRQWVTTTVAQLNFMRFANDYGIYQYVTANRVEIEADMNAAARSHKQKNKRRKPLSSTPGTIIILPEVTTLKF